MWAIDFLLHPLVCAMSYNDSLQYHHHLHIWINGAFRSTWTTLNQTTNLFAILVLLASMEISLFSHCGCSDGRADERTKRFGVSNLFTLYTFMRCVLCRVHVKKMLYGRKNQAEEMKKKTTTTTKKTANRIVHQCMLTKRSNRYAASCLLVNVIFVILS